MVGLAVFFRCVSLAASRRLDPQRLLDCAVQIRSLHDNMALMRRKPNRRKGSASNRGPASHGSPTQSVAPGPELVFGLVGPIGVRLRELRDALASALAE